MATEFLDKEENERMYVNPSLVKSSRHISLSREPRDEENLDRYLVKDLKNKEANKINKRTLFPLHRIRSPQRENAAQLAWSMIFRGFTVGSVRGFPS